MRVPVGDYILKADSNQFIVAKVMVREDGERKGEPYDKDIAFSTTIEAALKRIANQQLRESEATSLEDLRESLDAFHRDIAVLLPRGRPNG